MIDKKEREALIHIMVSSLGLVADLQAEISNTRAAIRYLMRDQPDEAEALLVAVAQRKNTATDKLVVVLEKIKEFAEGKDDG